MKVSIFGITGYREITIPLEELAIEDLDVGREFVFNNQIYEIRSIAEIENKVIMNVVQTME